MDIRQQKKQLKEINHIYLQELHKCCDGSFNRAVRSLRHNQHAPDRRMLLDDMSKKKINRVAKDLRTRTNNIITEIMNEIENRKSEPPDDDSLNYVSMLSMRSSITKEEIDSALNRYGDVFIVYTAIVDIARRQGLEYMDHPLTVIENSISTIAHTFGKLLADTNRNRDFQHEEVVSLLDFCIDALPDEI